MSDRILLESSVTTPGVELGFTKMPESSPIARDAHPATGVRRDEMLRSVVQIDFVERADRGRVCGVAGNVKCLIPREALRGASTRFDLATTKNNV